MVGKRVYNSKKKEEENAVKVVRQKTPTSPTPEPPAKKTRSKSSRKVQFNANPQILEITPLVEKPAGVVRMPEASKSVEEDMNSPTKAADELIVMLNDPLMDKLIKSENCDDNSQQSIEIIDASQTFTKPPAVKIKENSSKEIRPIPLLTLDDEPPQQATENNDTLENTLPLMDQHVLNDLEHYAFLKGKSKLASGKRLLWSQLFMPKRQEDFIGKSKADFLQLNEWLEKWYKRINIEKEKHIEEENKKKKKKKDEENKRKRRRSSNKFFEEELTDDYEEEDNDFEFNFEEPILNPAIISGPNGCGKSAMVYQSAKECKFEVIEISSSSKRDGQSLKQKVAGALENHNVQSQKQSDIRSLFGNNKTPQTDDSNNKKQQNDFSLLLIDECDLIYESDSNFWPTLRQICLESKIPIVLTCNDLEYVLLEIGKDVGNKDDFFVIQMERPSDRLFVQYLRHWFFGFTKYYHKTCSLFNLTTAKNKDPRAVLNSLHFGLWDLDISNDSSNRRSTSIEKEENFNLKEYQQRTKVLSKLDAAFGPDGKNISILTKCSINLDFNNEEEFLNNFCTEMEKQNNLRSKFFAYFDMDKSDLVLHPIVYKEIIKMFCLRSSNKLYSLRETCLYHLPCLLSIHQSWVSKINSLKQQYRQRDGSNLFSQSPRRVPPHPFDIVDTVTGAMLDQNKSLSSVIDQFQFPP
ncbi:hypothetical protein ACQ4LE_008384 [Meloidogyne hapla]